MVKNCVSSVLEPEVWETEFDRLGEKLDFWHVVLISGSVWLISP